MKTFMDYWLAQSLSLVFYMITLVVYNHARKEYVGGKIAAAINLIMVSLGILFLSDFADYFSSLILPIGPDTTLIIKILLKLVAICVLFFGGLKFFVSKQTVSVPIHKPDPLKEVDTEVQQTPAALRERSVDSTVILKEAVHAKPTLGRYEILEQIGRGAMGIVYKGLDPKLDRLTAIKTIRFTDDFEEDEVDKVREQFYQEAKVVAQLNHPNIVSIYDVGEDLDLSYLALEYLEGETLEKYTRADNLLPIEKCIDVMRQVCDALDYLHKHDIVHRDIKPANIMILTDGLVKLADFGIARAAAGSRTRTGIIKGTPYYMSPEQIKGGKVTGPSDIFSLGVVFYQLLTGRLPFSGENLSMIMYQITTKEPESPETFNQKIDKATVYILYRALAKNLQNRYRTAKEMGDQLRSLSLQLEAAEAQYAEAVSGPEDDKWDSEADIVPGAFLPGIELEKQEEEDLDFSDLEQILETGEEAEEAVEAGEEVFDRKLELDDISDEAIPGAGPGETADIEPPDHRMPDSGAEIQDLNIDISQYSPHYIHTETIEYEFPEIHEEPEADDEEIIDVGRKTGIGLIAQLKNPKVAIAGLMLVLFGIYSLFLKNRSPENLDAKKPSFTFNAESIKKDLKQEELERLEKIRQERQKELALLEQIKKEKQKEEERLSKLEEQKRQEAQRLASIAETERKEKERLAKIAEEKQKERERLKRIEKEKREEQERLVKIEKEKTDALRRGEHKEIEMLTALAKEFLTAKNYTEAKIRYETALELIERSRFKDEARFLTYKRDIEKALESEDIKYGSKGYVKYRGKWMTPDEREKMLYKEGFVRYRGQFVHYLELKDQVERFGYPVVQSFLSSKYGGRLIHKKQINLRGISLKQNTREHSRFSAYFSWEVWTFNEIGRGECPIEIIYHAEEDRWKIARGCE